MSSDLEPAVHEHQQAENPALTFKVVGLLGALMLIVGPFFPWAVVWVNGYEYPQNALQGTLDGVFVLGAGLLVACLGIARLTMKVPAAVLWTQLAVAVFIGWLVVYDMNAISTFYLVRLQTDPPPAPGAGIWVALMGAVLVAAGAIPVLLRRSAR